MRARLSFSQTADGRFLVLASLAALHPFEEGGPVVTALFDDEDAFITLVVSAGLDDGDKRQLVSTALLSVCLPIFPQRWVEVEMTGLQAGHLRLRLFTAQEQEMRSEQQDPISDADLVFGLKLELGRLEDFLHEAPSPFAVFSGPEHTIRFMNPSCLQLAGKSFEHVVGRPARGVFSALDGQSLPELLDRTFREGEPITVKEIPIAARAPGTAEWQSLYFDLVCFPAKGTAGEVAGVLLQATDVTGRVLARRESEHREQLLFSQWAELDAIYRATPVGMALFDARNFRVLRINQKQAELMGGVIAQLIGRSALDLATNLPGFCDLLQKVKEDHRVVTGMIREQAGNGGAEGRRWLVNLSPAPGATTEINTISSIFLEVPASAEQETTGAAAPQFFDVLESFTDGLFVLDRTWNFVYLNSRARSMLNNGENVLGRNLWEEYPLAKELPFWEPYHRTMEHGTPEQFEVYYPEPLFGWFDIRSAPARDGMSVFFRDITERKLEKQALRESEARFRALMDHSTQMIWTMGPGGRITDFGGPWQQLTGLSREQSLGHGFLAAVHPDDAGSLMQVFESAFAAGASVDTRWRMLLRNGKHCWVRSRAKPVLGPDGEVLKYYGSTEDVDEVMQLREALKEATVY